MDQLNPSSSSQRIDRKTVEKNRRNQMKVLHSKLNSLVTNQNTGEALSLPDQLDEATAYIKKLQVSLEGMKAKKNTLIALKRSISFDDDNGSGSGNGSINVKSRVEIHEIGDSALDVVLTTGLNRQFLFNEMIRLLHEEGADIVNASFSVVNGTVLHTIHSKIIGGFVPSPEASRISRRLKKLVDEANVACEKAT